MMPGALERLNRTLAEILYGMAVHDQVRALARQRGSLEHLFVLISFGDLLGVPILPPYYSLRLLPFVVPLINNWRRRMLRERDLIDSMF
ncbi:MAG: hypothetical protein ACRDGG_08385 [Anaerolineae bacterium]